MGNSAGILPPPPTLISSIDSTAQTIQSLETFSLFWLDKNVNSNQENFTAQKTLKLIINQLETFNNTNSCEQSIRQHKNPNSIVLIVSGGCGRELVPIVHNFAQLSGIYVYCRDIKANQEWSKKYSKIEAVVSKLDDLISKLAKDQPKREKDEERVGMDVYKHDSSHTSLKSENSSFMWFQLFVEVLLRMSTSSTAKIELVQLCRKGNYEKSNLIIDEFEREYMPEKAIWWYTRESFVYRILNKALRTQNLRVLIIFRFLIKDLYEQLKNEQEKQKINNEMIFYRGQGMTKEELEKIKSSINEFISMRSFLSTTNDRNIGLSFAYLANPNLEKVLLEIHANYSLATPFASISHLSFFQAENEILFMLGCIFRIEKVTFAEIDRVWIIQLSLSSTQDDHNLKQLFDHLKKEIGNETNLFSLGKILRRMGEYNHAEECIKQYLIQNTNPSIDQSRCYHLLGNICQERGDLDQALIYHKYSLDLKLILAKKNYENIGNSYNSIGAVYEKKGDYLLALRSYEKAKMMWRKCYKEKHERIAMAYNNIGIVYRLLNDHARAVENHTKALSIRQQVLPADHFDLASSHSNLASVYVKTNQLDQALLNYEIALNIQQKSVKENHKSLALTLSNIGNVYEMKGNFQLALDYYSRALKIYQQAAVLPTHHELIQTENSVKRCKAKIK